MKYCHLQNLDGTGIIMLNEGSQHRKTKYCMISLICELKKVNLIGVESRLVVTKGQVAGVERGRWGKIDQF
jgi:hypothetical protein